MAAIVMGRVEYTENNGMFLGKNSAGEIFFIN